MKWINAKQLEEWGNTRTSETEFPGLVSDLILATVNEINAIRFPTGEKGQVRGFDGNLISGVEGLNIPEGASLWEFGTEANYKKKANDDFDKRTKEVSLKEQQETTLILVTTFTWDSSSSNNKIEDWVSEKRKKSNWKNVRLIDGVQLET
ncbi:hypothetical protein [Vreelandella sp. EE22]